MNIYYNILSKAYIFCLDNLLGEIWYLVDKKKQNQSINHICSILLIFTFTISPSASLLYCFNNIFCLIVIIFVFLFYLLSILFFDKQLLCIKKNILFDLSVLLLLQCPSRHVHMRISIKVTCTIVFRVVQLIVVLVIRHQLLLRVIMRMFIPQLPLCRL